VRVGILGGGNISSTHARAAAAIDGARVVAVWGQNHAKAAAIAREYDAAPHADLSEFIAHPMDVVEIGSPSGMHADHIAAAAARGLHVLVEKPLDISVTRVDHALTIVREQGVKLGLFFQDRLKPDLRRVKALIDDGRLGRVLLVSAQVKWYRPEDYYANSRWRGTWSLDGGGALMNQGIHTIDTLLWLLGPVASLKAQAGTLLHKIEVEDTIVATLKFERGALCTFEATTAAYPGYPRRMEITGSDGTVIIEGDNLVAVNLRTPSPDIAVAVPAAHASASSPVVADASAHQRVFEDFFDAITNDRDPVCSGEAGRESVALVHALYLSAKGD
jgi:UDP-N-acetyl-2-amino-2-deoxyglucuronate dehydrogenase